MAGKLDTVKRIFIDTAPVIYYVEKNPVFLANVQGVFQHLDDSELSAVVSPITLAECLVLPYKLDKPEVAQLFIDLLVKSESILFYPMDETTADKAANLRARYNLTLTDAFQLAVAIQSGCDAFLTNDIDLKRILEISVLLVSELE